MPLILDDATMDSMAANMPMELETDLFGDPVLGDTVLGDSVLADSVLGDTVALGLPTHAAPSKQLQQRLEDLRSRGCCQTVAWSKQGTIASVGADGRSVDLYFLRSHPKDGTWGLSEPTPYTQFGAFLGGPIVHLSWAATSSPELAVIDSVGRITVLTFSMSLNRPYQLRTWDSDPVDDIHAIVGCYWLPLMPQSKQYNVLHGPALREGNNYKYDSTYVHAFGPYHPNPAKSAMLCVTTNGFLKLYFPQNNNKIQETPLELESVTTSDDLITHASMCSEKNQPSGMLYIALATASKQLRVVRAAIQWGLPQSEQPVPPGSMPLNPSLHAKPVAVTSFYQPDSSENSLDASMTLLSHIEMLPSALTTPPDPVWSPPVVLTVRSYVPAVNSSYDQEAQSIIDRWEVVAEPSPALHPAFEQLGSRSTQALPSQQSARLRKLEPITINKVIISFHLLQFGKVICIAFSDGTVQYRDRFTMNEIYNEINVSRIMMPNQVGFEFTESSPCLQVAFSPTNCSFVQLCEDGKVKWNSLRYPIPDIGSTPQDAQYSAIVAALTTAVSAASFNQMAYDDILAMARQFADKPRFAYDWMMEIVRMLKINVDYSEDTHHDPLVRNASLQLCLSILNHLGFKGEFQPRAFCGKFALLALNVRNIVILITIASNTPVNLKEKLSPLDEPEVVDALAGCAKWALDLLAYLTDCLFNLLDEPKFMNFLSGPNYSEMVGYLQSRNEVALHLLVCSSTRGFLSAACRRLIHLDSLSNRAIQYYENKAASDPTGTSRTQPALSTAYQKMQRYTSSSLIKVQEFDKLLSTLGADIRNSYQTSLARLGQSAAQASAAHGQQQQGQAAASESAIKRAQAHCELTILLANTPPHSFFPVISKFFKHDLKEFRSKTDPAKLFFADYSMLEVDDDDKMLATRRARGSYVDVFKRTELKADKRSRDSSSSNNNLNQGPLPGAAGGGSGPSGLWRRCVRCASIMEDVYGQRPGYTFVLAQQRKCSCGGAWGLLPPGSLVS